MLLFYAKLSPITIFYFFIQVLPFLLEQTAEVFLLIWLHIFWKNLTTREFSCLWELYFSHDRFCKLFKFHRLFGNIFAKLTKA
jgi:hypothetical protein